VVTWLVFTVLAAQYFVSPRLVEFDPSHHLLNREHQDIVDQVASIDSLVSKDLANSIIHFTSPGCSCTQFSAQHKQQIDENGRLQKFNIFNVELKQSQLSQTIPSTPAILIVDKHGELMFLGPYSKGLACSQSAGFVELVMSNYQAGFNTKLVIDQAKGCYCHS